MMQNSPNQQDQPLEQDHRESNIMGDSAAMTIEFLRARLLSERSVSKTARQRSDELAMRVAELEEQLKLVSLQRKKAEKATAEVLTVLENYGMTEFSEDFSWSSDDESTHCDSRIHNKSMKADSHVTLKVSNNDADDASPVCGKSLSWKSSKNSLHSHEKQYMSNTSRRRSSFSCTAPASPKQRVGKSCRKIRRRETRSSVEELDSETSMLSSQEIGAVTCAEGYPNCCEIGSEVSREGSENQEEQLSLNDPVLGSSKNDRDLSNAGPYLIGHASDKDMENALKHQAQLIGQNEAQEKAQREWEEKYIENNSSNHDSCENGNQSDVTEEKEAAKALVPPYPALRISSYDQDANFNKESHESVLASESSPSEFTFPLPEDNQISRCADVSIPAAPESKEVSRLDCCSNSQFHMHSRGSSGNQSVDNITSSHSATSSQLALIPPSTSDNLGSILEALHEAKLSLAQKLDSLPAIKDGSIGKPIEKFPPSTRAVGSVEVPVGCSTGLFRVPTDFHFETTSQSNYTGSDSSLSLIDHNSHNRGFAATARDRFLTLPLNPYMESRYGFPTSKPSSEPLFDMGVGGHPYKQFPDPRVDVGISSYKNPFGPHLDMDVHSHRSFTSFAPNLDTTGLLSSSRYISPSYPDLIPKMPSSGSSRPLSRAESVLPPAHHYSTFNNHHSRPNMFQ